jgi:hypothetical protein
MKYPAFKNIRNFQGSKLVRPEPLPLNELISQQQQTNFDLSHTDLTMRLLDQEENTLVRSLVVEEVTPRLVYQTIDRVLELQDSRESAMTDIQT